MADQRGVGQELHDFTMALAKADVREGIVPLEIFAAWANVAAPREDEHGAFIVRAGGAIIIRPVITTASRTFETAEEVQAFIDVQKGKL